MSENTKIEWATHTANLWWGCDPVHAGCDNCYARTLARAKGKAEAWKGARFATVGIWKELPKWNAAARDAGRIDSVFCGSMMDIFEKSLPALNWQGVPIDGVETGHIRERFFREIVPATPNLLYLLLTKRPSNILKMVPREWLTKWPANVMTGTSPVNQPTADTLIPQLLRVPGRHFLSMEPLLGPVDLRSLPMGEGEANCLKPDLWETEIENWRGTSDEWQEDFEDWYGIAIADAVGPMHARIDWVIVGGESGPGARPMHPDLARSLRDQCNAAGVPFLFKQWGEWGPDWEGAATCASCGRTKFDAINAMGECGHCGVNEWNAADRPLDKPRRVGKKAAGRLLDGIEHNGYPGATCAT